MAEKAFKVPSLGLVGTTAELSFALASNELTWNTLPLATQAYVDTAVGNVSVNVTALAGNGLTSNAQNELDVSVGTGLYLTGDAVAVNVNSIAGDGLSTSMGQLTVNPGTGIYLTGDAVAVNTNVIATVAYVDAVAEGLHIHPSVVAATTASVDLSKDLEAGKVIDGVTLVAGDRVLVKNQVAPNISENGIYVAVTSGAASRATDYDTASEIDAGDFVFVSGGTLYNNTGWVQTDTVTTLGTDPIVFQQFSGAGTYTAGNGLVLNGNEFAVNVNAIAGNGLTVSGNTIVPNVGSSLYVDSMINTLNVNTSVVASNLISENYGAASFFIANDSAKSLRKVNQAAAQVSDTWETVATLDYASMSDPKTFEVIISLRLPGSGGSPDLIRSSKLSGIFVGSGSPAEYTEYAIVESGGSAIPGADIQVTSGGDVQFKATLNIGEILTAVAETTTLGVLS